MQTIAKAVAVFYKEIARPGIALNPRIEQSKNSPIQGWLANVCCHRALLRHGRCE